ncbi:uncharacterized protein MONOS_797 [Monocercomonoides exilis]|uniref:uncharacterized protein n=1 Tax=Monocercomonoides exilis TaxID=2049356 RepID=UPI00355AAD4D|nr:hypothetical protein MONOS_797 [Monocercomonoides exilis]|eukprot:MONOS_797.1-p1 / transcript=MONOS_797.1 / gene=MONOS_797 / organism=Monocercomonoides_exilis_PA203 / gene_product=unspecified product / transcript_product=unspecified product / location=Mono_scaffold00013:151982-152926(-) / protein_length=279 / sequence_SO=supercontig / SO=protein_coding / is_pseudo=false
MAIFRIFEILWLFYIKLLHCSAECTLEELSPCCDECDIHPLCLEFGEAPINCLLDLDIECCCETQEDASDDFDSLYYSIPCGTIGTRSRLFNDEPRGTALRIASGFPVKIPDYNGGVRYSSPYLAPPFNEVISDMYGYPRSLPQAQSLNYPILGSPSLYPSQSLPYAVPGCSSPSTNIVITTAPSSPSLPVSPQPLSSQTPITIITSPQQQAPLPLQAPLSPLVQPAYLAPQLPLQYQLPLQNTEEEEGPTSIVTQAKTTRINLKAPQFQARRRAALR